MKNTQFPNGGGQREESFQAGGTGETRTLLPGTAGFCLPSSAGLRDRRLPEFLGQPQQGSRRVFLRSFYLPLTSTRDLQPEPFPLSGALLTPAARAPGRAIARGGGARRCPAVPVPAAGAALTCPRPGALRGVCCPPGDTGGLAPPHRHRLFAPGPRL